MIIVDTSVWIDHIRKPIGVLGDLLVANEVRQHPFVVGEIMLGSIATRDETVAGLLQLPTCEPAALEALLDFIAVNALSSCGIGFVDAHLLLSAKTGEGRLWTFDKRLAEQAKRLQLDFRLG